MLDKFLSALHSRLFNFILLPIIIVILFVSLVHWGDIATRGLIIAQFIPLAGLAYLISKGIIGKVNLESILNTALEDNLPAAIVYLAIVFARIIIFFSLAIAYAIALHNPAG